VVAVVNWSVRFAVQAHSNGSPPGPGFVRPVGGSAGQGLTFVHFFAQPGPFLSLTDGRRPAYPAKHAHVELKKWMSVKPLAPGPSAAPEDPELRKRIEKLAEYCVKNGPEFEQMMRSKQEDNPQYHFLFGGRGAHSSTFQLNPSRFWSLMPQLPSTSQLNLRRFFVDETPQTAHENCSRHAEKWTRVVHEKCLR